MIYRKLILFCAAFTFLFLSFETVRAEIVVNEVELSPTTERFLEIYNTGDSAVDLTDWYIQRKTATGSTFGSLVSKTNFEGKTIAAHGYFVISKNVFSNSDIVLDSLTLTESNTIQIKNADEEVVDKVGWGDSTECGNPCPANPPEGKSIQKVGGSWVVGTPTRGIANEDSSSEWSGESGGDAPASNSIEGGSAVQPVETYKIKAKITAKNISFAGLPLNFHGSATGYNGENLIYGKFFVNFGDGDSKEVRMGDAENFSHTYFYPGDYVVTSEYFLNPYGVVPDASSQIAIKVVKPEIIISTVGGDSDFFVELTNNTDYEADISNWILGSASVNFTFPKNTIIGSKKKMTISSMLTHFTSEDRSSLKLMTPQWRVIHDFSPVTNKKISTVTEKEGKIEEDNLFVPKNSEPIPLENISAAAIESGIIEEAWSGYIFTISALLFVGFSAGTVYFIRRKKTISALGNDFKILDEN